MDAYSCPARGQLCLGTLKAHHPAGRNKGYELPRAGAQALLPSVNPQVFLNCMHQPIHDESPMLIQGCRLISCVHLAVSLWRLAFQTPMEEEIKVIKGRPLSACPTEDFKERYKLD
ncbi:hypothetical protein INR49_016516 [Caranx melampygus]|nr:hypothetical protein INR49_016516 [Caranx melampygus]